MNKKVLSIVLALAITLCLSIAVMASTAAPGGNVNIDPIVDLVWDQDQDELTQKVTGYVAFDSSNDGPKLETLELKVQKVGSKEWTVIDSKDYNASTGSSEELSDRSDDQGLEFDFENDWTIEAEGTYKLRVIATFTNSFSKAQATTPGIVIHAADEGVVEDEEEDLDEDDDADTLNEDGDNCPAAPAVAGKILKEGGFKNHYDGGNFIADVAKEMGPNGEFQGVEKCDTEEYQEKIEAFLENHDAWEEEITKETHQNQSDKKPKHNQK
jgi:hypothetical protein